MQAEKSSEYSRLLRACGFYGPHASEQRVFRSDVARFLRMSLAEAMAEFAALLEKTSVELRGLPLARYKRPADLKAAWHVVQMPPPVSQWDFLSRCDPEKAGILCGRPKEAPVLFAEESLDGLWQLEGAPGALELWRSLARWRSTVCAVWAGNITHDLVLMMRGGRGTPLLCGATDIITHEKPELPGRIGGALELADVEDEEADRFFALCDRAAFGSRTCEHEAARALREWLRAANIGVLQESGLGFAEAHYLMMAATQPCARMEVELRWNQGEGRYRFECVAENLDRHGYPDEARSSGIPAEVILRSFENAVPGACEGLLRLVLRAAHYKCRELLLKSLHSELD